MDRSRTVNGKWQPLPRNSDSNVISSYITAACRGPAPASETSGNVLLDKLYGATLHGARWTGDRNGAIRDLAQRLTERGRRPFVVPYGVSSGFGAAAYATAALEIAQQARQRAFEPAAILHASGSGGTQAGLIVGASLSLPGTRVIGVDVDSEPERVRADVAAYVAQASQAINANVPESAIEVVAGFAGPGYGVMDEPTWEAIQLAGRLEVLILDPVYTGKALAGLIGMIRAGRWKTGDDVVFLHTGGAPALFAYADVCAAFLR